MPTRHARHVHPFKLLLAAVFAACFSTPGAFAQTTPRYTVTDLGPFTPRGVNEMGQVAGVAVIDGRQYAALYDGTFKTINPPETPLAEAWGINNHGTVVGSAFFCDAADSQVNCRTRAYLYSGGKFTVLGTLGGRDSRGFDINDAGLTVGSSYTAGPAPNIGGEEQAFASGGGALEDIGAKIGVSYSHASGVNSVGQVTGFFSERTNGVGLFLYDSRDGSFSISRVAAAPNDVNDLGQIVGDMNRTDGGAARAFLFEGGTLKDLGTLLPSHTSSMARAVNNAGQIVGVSSESWFTRRDERAFLYEGGSMLDLNGLIPAGTGWVLNEATDINGQGQIVGRGLLNGQERAFMLTPTQPLVLLTEPNSARALALDSVTFERSPFTLASPHNFSSDGRRRITLLARNLEFAPGESAQQLIVRAEGSMGELHLLPVEHVVRVRGFPSLTQITVRLPDGLAAGGDFQLSLVLRGTASNKATLSISPPPAP